MQDKKYLLQFLATIKGNKYVESALRKMQGTTQTTTGKMKSSFQSLDKIHQKTGANVGRVSKIISTSVSNSVDRQGRSLKHVTTMWSGVDKQMHKTSFTAIRSKGAWHKLSNTFKVIPAQLNKMGTASAQMIKALKRVMIVVPMWMLFRSVIRGITSTVRMITTGLIDLDEALARIKTVTHGTAESIERDMIGIREIVMQMAIKTRAPIKDLAEAFYFLKTANLETEEAMSAFIPTIHAMIGTGNSAKDTARAVAGMYNTMGDALGENLTITEKFTKIADILTYTYATQDVQLQELIQSYTKLAPYLTGLEDSFEDMVTMLGFLNTRLLRAGRTGRLTGRAIMQLTKNADKLARIFDITFDPDRPLYFLGIIKQIHNKIGGMGKITARQSEALREVFATRGAVAVRILIEHFGDLEKAIELAGKDAEGFAEKMHAIKMDTIRGQMQRLQNIVIATNEAFIRAWAGTDSFKDALNRLNNNLEQGIFLAGMFGTELRIFFHNLKVMSEWLPRSDIKWYDSFFPVAGLTRIRGFGQELKKARKEAEKSAKEFANLSAKRKSMFDKMKAEGLDALTIRFHLDVEGIGKQIEEARKKMEEAQKKVSLLEPLNRAEELQKWANQTLDTWNQMSESLKEQLELQEDSEEAEERRLINVEREKITLDFLLNRLKVMGFTEKQISEVKLKRLKTMAGENASEKEKLGILKAQQAVTVADMKERRTLAEKLVGHEIDLMKIRGISGSQLIRARMAIEQSVLGRLDETRALELALQLEKELTKEKEAQKNLSNESLKIWKIALKYGVKDAEAISQLLKGEIERKDLSETQLRIFEEQFKNLAEQMKAYEYFFEGKGKKIGVKERIPTTKPRREIWETERKIKEKMIGVTVPIDIKSEINIRVDGKRVTDNIIKKIVSEMRKNESTIRKAIDSAIEEF